MMEFKMAIHDKDIFCREEGGQIILRKNELALKCTGKDYPLVNVSFHRIEDVRVHNTVLSIHYTKSKHPWRLEFENIECANKVVKKIKDALSS